MTEDTEQGLFSSLKKVTFFQRLSDEVITKLCEIVSEVTFQKGEVVFEEGDAGDAMYIIVSGEAAILKIVDKEKKDYKSLGIVAEGELFGEMTLFDLLPRSATVMARKNLHLLRISNSNFQTFLREDTKSAAIVLFEFVAILARRLREGAREQVAVYETGKTIASCANVNELVSSVFSIVQQAVPTADAGFIALYNKFTEELDIKISTGFSPDEMGGGTLTLDEPLLKILMETRQFHEGNPSSQLLIREGKFSGTKSVIAYPIFSLDTFIGFLALFSRTKEQLFTLAQKNLLLGICSQIAPAIENAAYRREDDERIRLQRMRY
ncbi:MAG: cyclic nucleotide-binding domain-containing protein [Candidatus Eremiobacteraeota bacterium]|nr:cyclic nucleotide-binding domain-containing protein [Candidatus Eremiobacteraeota bacterium]